MKYYSKKYGTYWKIETNKDIFKGINNSKELHNAAYQFLKDGNKNFSIIDKLNNDNVVRFIGDLTGEYFYGSNIKKLNHQQKKMKYRMTPSIDDLIENAHVFCLIL